MTDYRANLNHVDSDGSTFQFRLSSNSRAVVQGRVSVGFQSKWLLKSELYIV